MTTRITSRKGAQAAPPAQGSTLTNPVGELSALVRDLGKATAKIARKSPPDSVRERFTDALREVQAAIGEALIKLRAVEPLVDDQPAAMPEPDAEGHYPAAETLRAIVARQIA